MEVRAITVDEADELSRAVQLHIATPLGCDDYELSEQGHVYTLEDGSVVVIGLYGLCWEYREFVDGEAIRRGGFNEDGAVSEA